MRKLESLASESATLHAYLREIASFPSLTPDDELDLARRIQQHGDEDALSRLVQSNLRFVVAYARRFRRLGVPLLDLIHEGNLGLIEAARRFVPSPPGTFQSSAVWWIRQAVLHLLADGSQAPAMTSADLTSAAVSGRQPEAIRVALAHAQAETADEDGDNAEFRTSLHEDLMQPRSARKKPRRGTGGRHLDLGTLHALRHHSALRGYLN